MPPDRQKGFVAAAHELYVLEMNGFLTKAPRHKGRLKTKSPARKKQLLTYLMLTGLKLGFLLNLGNGFMQNGITRTINGQLDE